jgi:hypothetical protein
MKQKGKIQAKLCKMRNLRKSLQKAKQLTFTGLKQVVRFLEDDDRW